MTTARQQLVSTDLTTYYHCVSRCVRRCFLCGHDPLTRRSYEHRRDWIEHQLYALAHLYCIDICAYAVMSNHYHLVLNINKNKALTLTNLDVVERWGRGHALPALIQRWQRHQLSSEAEERRCLELIDVWRARLWSLSWFMKELNYHIACKANQEDNCSGHFWESRFKSQALLDEKALVAAMAYVDLNPIRAGVASQPESSEFTSIKARIDALQQHVPSAPGLYPFIGTQGSIKQLPEKDGIPFRLIDYLELIDWTARQHRQGKASLNPQTPAMLTRLALTPHCWLSACCQLEKRRASAVGNRIQAALAKYVFNKKKVHLYLLE